MDTVKIGNTEVSRFILGSNPFSGFSHQTVERNHEMVHYYNSENIKKLLREAETLGINAVIARGDHHMQRVLMEYWDEGGSLQWLGQTCPELGEPEKTLSLLHAAGCPASHIHGGYTDHLMENGQLEKLKPTVEYARKLGMTIGCAGHIAETIRWVRDNLDVDYYMCSYYNPIPRKVSAEHQAGYEEMYLEEDRQAMLEVIRTLDKPVIHYKVLAAGRHDPREALPFVVEQMRPGDAVCVGIFAKDNPNMLAEDVDIFMEALAAATG